MTNEHYWNTYKDSIFEILDEYINKERNRLSQVIKEECGSKIRFEKYNFERLNLAIMLQEGKCLIENL